MVRFPKVFRRLSSKLSSNQMPVGNLFESKGSSQKHETQHDTTANALGTSFGSRKQLWTLPLEMNQETACSMQRCIFREIISASVLSFQQLGIRKICLAIGEGACEKWHFFWIWPPTSMNFRPIIYVHCMSHHPTKSTLNVSIGDLTNPTTSYYYWIHIEYIWIQILWQIFGRQQADGHFWALASGRQPHSQWQQWQ